MSIWRDALVAEISADPRVSSVQTAGTHDGAVALTMATKPDVVVIGALIDMHTHNAGMDAVALCRRIRPRVPNAAWVLLAWPLSPLLAREAILAGIAGILTRHRDGTSALRAAIFAAAEGAQFYSQAAAESMADVIRSGVRLDLSQQEARVLEHLVSGAELKEIAIDMGVVPGTVANYISRLCRKLGVPADSPHSVIVQRARVVGLLP